MMTVKEKLLILVNEIKRRPEESQRIIGQFKTGSDEVDSFLTNLRAPIYLIPAIVTAFAYSYRIKDPANLLELSKMSNAIDSLFCLNDGTGYTFLGVEENKAVCRPDNSQLIERLDLSTPIKWIF